MSLRIVSDEHCCLASSLGGGLRGLSVGILMHIGNKIVPGQVGINWDIPLLRAKFVLCVLTRCFRTRLRLGYGLTKCWVVLRIVIAQYDSPGNQEGVLTVLNEALLATKLISVRCRFQMAMLTMAHAVVEFCDRHGESRGLVFGKSSKRSFQIE